MALDLLKSQRMRIDNLQLQNSDLINGPGRPLRIIRNPTTLDQHSAAVQSVITATDNLTLTQVRSESPAVAVVNCNGISSNLQHAVENTNSQVPPALPPRSSQKEPPPRVPAHPSITTGINNGDAQPSSMGINGHPIIGRKYSPNGASTSGNASIAVSQSSDAPPLPPPRGTQNPPPTPPPLQPRGTTPPPAMAVVTTSATQQLNSHQGNLRLWATLH